jgi:hypothetical protein
MFKFSVVKAQKFDSKSDTKDFLGIEMDLFIMYLKTETQRQDMGEQSCNLQLKTSSLLHFSNTEHNLGHEQGKFLQCATLGALTVEAREPVGPK